MRKWIAGLLVFSMLCLTGCAQSGTTEPTETQPIETAAPTVPATDPVLEGDVTEIVLDGQTVTVNGLAIDEENAIEGGVSVSRDIIYYEDKETYESGNPYGEGTEADMHTAEEAAGHIVVNITAPGNYRLSGNLDLGQIRIDLGEDAYEDPTAVVNLILNGVTVNCTVAPAILFQSVYECDGNWSADTAKADVDTTAAGANLILAAGSQNTVAGSHVAKIFKDKEGEKKLWKQDGAIYSYMSMNVAGTGTLDLYADNEGLDTELHLTINSGNLNIRSDNDGINTNEDGVSVTTINGGNIHIIAGLGAEGDGVDSNGYLVINGGTVVASANPAADAGLDSDLGSYINGGTVIALGSTMDWAESDSDQVTMNLQFSQMASSGSSVVIAKEDGSVVFAYDPGEDEVLGENVRTYMGAVISCPNFQVGESYQVFIGSDITGTETGGVYAAADGFSGGTQQAYTGTDVMRGPGGMGGFGGGQRPEGDMDFSDGMTPPDDRPERPEDDGTVPEKPGGNMGDMSQGDQQPPEGTGDIPTMPEDWTMPEGEHPEGGFGGMGSQQFGQGGEANSLFYMQDKVNFFSGLTPVTTE